MPSAVVKAGVLVLATLLFSGCSAQRATPLRGHGEVGGDADRRPCIANFSVEGGYWSGYAVKCFQDYPDSSADGTVAYLFSAVASLGYSLDASDRAAGWLNASYRPAHGKEATTRLTAAVTGINPAGVRVTLTFTTAGMVTFSVEEVQKEFCSLLEGVPRREKPRRAEPQIREEPPVGKKPPLVEETLAGEKPPVAEERIGGQKPPVVETPPPPAARTPQPLPIQRLVVKKTVLLREKASFRSAAVGQLKKGERLEILSRSGGWFRVKSSAGLTGWIFKTQVRRLP